MKNLIRTFTALYVITVATFALAEEANQKPKPKYKTQELTVAQVDEWLGKPEQVLIVDIRRPDELISFGSFPAFLSVQFKDLEKLIGYIPKDRNIITVSNHANRAFAAGDLLSSKGYKVVGATGSENYEKSGGKQVTKIEKPAPKPATAQK